MKQKQYSAAETDELLELIDRITANHPWEKFIKKYMKRTLKKLDKNKDDLQDLLNIITDSEVQVVTAIHIKGPDDDKYCQ